MLRYGAENMFKGMEHLYSKQFCFDVETNQGTSIYLWDSRENAKNFYNEQFMQQFEQSMGTTPTVEYLENIVTVDNRAGDILPA